MCTMHCLAAHQCAFQASLRHMLSCRGVSSSLWTLKNALPHLAASTILQACDEIKPPAHVNLPCRGLYLGSLQLFHQAVACRPATRRSCWGTWAWCCMSTWERNTLRCWAPSWGP